MALQCKVGVPIPEIVVEGERDQWPYLVITRMSGEVGEEVWPKLSEDQKERILRQIGQVISEVQRVPAGKLLELEPRWDQFILKQIQNCRTRHERLGLPQKYLDGLETYLSEAALIARTDRTPVILTGEYIPENFLMREDSTGWNLSGLIDFGDVMTGWGEYDLLGPSTFMCGGIPGRVRSLFAGFGYGKDDLSAALSKRLMTLFLLHRYSNPSVQIRIDDWQQKAHTLHDLEKMIWPI